MVAVEGDEEVEEDAPTLPKGGRSETMATWRNRRVPLRTCVACGKKTEKEALVRLVARPDGGVEVDPSGKASGRGAYVCRDGGCAGDELKKGRIDSTLRRSTTEQEWAALRSSIRAATDPQ